MIASVPQPGVRVAVGRVPWPPGTAPGRRCPAATVDRMTDTDDAVPGIPAVPGALQTAPLLADTALTLRLLRAVEDLRGPLREVVAGLERELDLPLPLLLVLQAVADGSLPGAALPAPATEALLTELRAAGLVDGGGVLRPTERGRIRLSQANALGVRVADVLAAVLGPEDGAVLVGLLERLAAGLPRA